MPILFMKRYTPAIVLANTDKMFVFGDNDTRVGYGGQAQIRGLVNTIGVRTKKTPHMADDAFYGGSPAADIDAIEKLTYDLDIVETVLRGGVTVVWPEDGIGTGRAQLDARSPVAFEYLQRRVAAFVEQYGTVSP